MESRIKRIETGVQPEPINLMERTKTRLQINENYVKELKAFLGEKESDPMIKSAIAYLEHDIQSVEHPETVKLINSIDKKLTPEDLHTILEDYGAYLEDIYDTKIILWETYDRELTRYAKANNIKETFYGPNLKPLDSKEDTP